MEPLATHKHDPLGPTHEARADKASYPLVSVIVPAYNVEAYIDRCIDSIIHQTYGNFELIVVDDGSTDATGGLCDAWARRDGRIRVHHEQNAGVSAARNRAMDHAHGAYVTFVDSDDYLKPRYLERLVTLALDNDADISRCSHYLIGTDNKLLTSYLVVRTLKSGIYDSREYLLQRNLIDIWCNLIKADLCRKERFDLRFDIDEDHLFLTSLALKSSRIAVCPDKLYFYQQRADGLTGMLKQSINLELNAKRIEVFLEIYHKLLSLGDQELAHAMYERTFRTMTSELFVKEARARDRLEMAKKLRSLAKEAFRSEGFASLQALVQLGGGLTDKSEALRARRWLFMHVKPYRKRQLAKLAAKYE